MVDKNDSKHFIRNPEEFLDLLTGLGIPSSSDKKVPKTNLQNSETQDLESGLKYHWSYYNKEPVIFVINICYSIDFILIDTRYAI